MRAWTPAALGAATADVEVAAEGAERGLGGLPLVLPGGAALDQPAGRLALAARQPREVLLEHRDLDVAVVDVAEQVLEAPDLLDVGREVVVEEMAKISSR